jgi:uncharacterized membrane protein
MSPIIVHLFLITIVVYSSLLFLGCWLIASRGHKPRPGEDVPGPEEMSRHRVGMYYCNANDPRGWVPKSGDPERSNGYTINMRYRSWVAAYNSLFAGGLVLITLVGVAAPLLIK